MIGLPTAACGTDRGDGDPNKPHNPKNLTHMYSSSGLAYTVPTGSLNSPLGNVAPVFDEAFYVVRIELRAGAALDFAQRLCLGYSAVIRTIHNHRREGIQDTDYACEWMNFQSAQAIRIS